MQRASLHSLFFVIVLVAMAGAALGFTSLAGEPPAPRPVTAATLSAGEGPLAMTASLTQTKIAQYSNGRTTLSLTLKASQMDPAHVALPLERGVDIVVVLDRSGSMRGEKLAGAKEALRTLVKAMTPNDRFALLTYSDTVQTLNTLTYCTPSVQETILRNIESLHAGGNTNLGSGLEEGVRILRNTDAGDNTRLVLMVSDGRANRGVTDPVALGRIAGRGLADDIMVSSVGVGLDFNEYLMTRLADMGGGSYRFLEDPRSFAAGFFEEFATARKVVASNMEVHVPLPKGVQVLEASGYPVTTNGRTAIIRPGSLAAGSSRTLHISLQVDSHDPSYFNIGPVRVKYGHLGTPRTLQLHQSLQLACVADELEAQESIDKTSWEQKVITEDYNKLKEKVAGLLREGDETAATAAIDAYAQEKEAANAIVGSEKVEQNLEQDVAGLRSQVEEVRQAPQAAKPDMQNKAAKQLQHESYRLRRDKQ